MPQRQQITDAFLRAAKPPAVGTTTMWDGTLKHFGVRISQGGAKSFIILVGSGRRQTIGRFPTISIAQARLKAKSILAERTLGRHQPQTISWDAARDQYLQAVKGKTRPRTHQEYERTLRRYFPFGSQRLGDITKSDVARRLDKLASTPSQQNHALVVAKIFFNWAIKRGYLDHNPTLAAIPNKTQPRSRVLTDKELQLIWRACEQRAGDGGLSGPATGVTIERKTVAASTLPAHFAKIVQLLILTGARRGEIAALQTSWISNDCITFPASVCKNGREHTLPIGAISAKLIPTSTSPNVPIFLARGSTSKPFAGWSKSKAQLDQLSGVTNWTLHDLRRTYASNMARLEVRIEVIERLLNHTSGTFAGIVGVYQRHDFMKEMRAAVDKHDEFIRRLVLQ